MLRTMFRRLRWGILGTGNIARQFAGGAAASQRCEVTAVASRTAESAKSFATTNRVQTAYSDYGSLLKDSQIDVVYNSLPNSMHHEWTIKALRAGKHVLCEKPIAMSAAEAQEMFDVARQTGKILAEAFMYRSHPLTHAVLKAVRDGAIGQLRLIRTSFCFRTTKIAGNIRFSPELGGGGLMDVGCYCINFSRLFAGEEPSTMTAAACLHESGVDELAVGTMQFPAGVLATFTCGMTTQSDNTAYLCGSEGFIEVPIPWKPPKESIFVIARGTPPRMDGPPTPSSWPPPREVVKINVVDELYGLEADDFATTVMDGKTPAISMADSIGNMRVLDQLRKLAGLS
jgi:D-xylose 1-dehydrogenase (NADP+, D-xylono-1,5-lactone-forming)